MPLNEADARRHLDDLLAKYYKLNEPSNQAEKRAMSEDSVVRQFIDLLLRDVLGWPIEDPVRYKYELVTAAGRPDMTLFPERGQPIFVEAKKFGILKPLTKTTDTLISRAMRPAQMSLPGITNDRTQEEQQAINYAFQNGGEWSILTNFEVLRLFNARRDWLVLSFEDPAQYRDDFDLLWQLAYHNVINGSLDALSSQRLAPDIDSAYLAFINEWRQKLAENLLARRDKNPWLFNAEGGVRLGDLRAVVQQLLDRLVVTRFAEDWLVIEAGKLYSYYEQTRLDPYSFTLDERLDRFFRVFDEKHNSALFARSLVDEASFGDDVLLPLVEKLYEVRYRAMPADILGNTYEQYLGKALVVDGGKVATRDNLETRKKQGSYYTPQVIVRYLVAQSLGRYLYATEDGTPDGTPIAGEARKTSFDVRALRVLDSASGSGSFLIEAFYVLKDFYRRELPRLVAARDALITQLAAQAGGDTLALEVEARRLALEIERIQNPETLILESHLYGVDLDPQAAEVAVVNLIMRAMERGAGSKRLPLLLNQNIKVGNGLVGILPDDPRMAEHAPALADILRLRAALVATPHGAEHDRIIVELGEKTAAVRAALDAHIAPHFSEMARVRPFHWGLEFPEVFYDEQGGLRVGAGFTIVLGNPPWEIVMPELREYYAQFDSNIESRLNRAQVEMRIEELDRENPARRQDWEALQRSLTESTQYYRKSGDFTRQGSAHTGTHKLFVERMWRLLRDGGRLGYVIPSGIYTDLGTKDLRQMLLDEGHIQYVYSFSNERFFFNGVDHRFKFALIGAQKGTQADGFWATFRFNPRVAVKPGELPDFLANRDNLIYVKRESIARFSPGSLSMMEFQTAQDYAVAEKIYGDLPLIGALIEDRWNVKLNQEFNVTSDRGMLNQNKVGIPLYEGKMIHQFDAHFAEPQYWISHQELAKLAAERQAQVSTYRVVHRRIARSTDERTLISAIVPPNTACEVNATVVVVSGEDQEKSKLFTCAMLNSFVLDYLIRYKVSTTLNMFYLYSLPLSRLMPGNRFFDAIVPRAARLVCTRPEFAPLWQDVMGRAWQERDGATLLGDRVRLRAEIDGLVAHVYGLSEAEFVHILGTFPLVSEAVKAAAVAAYREVERGVMVE